MSDPQQYTNRSDPRFARWWKSSKSNGNDGCLYVASTDGLVAVADSKAGPDAPIRVFDLAAWAAFVGGVKQGTLV